MLTNGWNLNDLDLCHETRILFRFSLSRRPQKDAKDACITRYGHDPVIILARLLDKLNLSIHLKFRSLPRST